MEDLPAKPGYAALRRFRESKAGAGYFLTSNLAKRGNGLEVPELTDLLAQQWRQLESDGCWLVRSAVVMPDHVHLLVELGAVNCLAECTRLLKGRAAPALRARGLKWQEGFYEHRLREGEDVMPVFLYIFLNPYEAGLITKDQTWSGYFCAPADWQWFGEMTAQSMPQLEWLK